MFNRKELSNKYYKEWKPINSVSDDEESDKDSIVDYYNEYISMLIKFINELDTILPTVKKVDFKKNDRQIGGYARCILDYPDKGYNFKHRQFEQSYKELMVDYLFYSDDLEYDEISQQEIFEMKKMAYFLMFLLVIKNRYYKYLFFYFAMHFIDS